MIARVAVVPHPPILVPEVAAGAAQGTAAPRDACLLAARALARHTPRAPGHFGESWQVGAAAAQVLASVWRGELLYSDAPYAVADRVALWDAVEQDPLP